MINVLFGSEPPSAVGVAAGTAPLQKGSPLATAKAAAAAAAAVALNNSQREAVAFALATRDVALIHGPPGALFSRICC